VPESDGIDGRKIVVDLIDAAVLGESKDALLGNDRVEFELARLHIEPGRIEQVVEPQPGSLKVEVAIFVG
jgi:hypothetical protein